jgi:integrase
MPRRPCAISTSSGRVAIDKITTEHVAAYMAAKAAEGLQIKTISKHLNFATGYSRSRSSGDGLPPIRWLRLTAPRVSGTDPDIRYLDRDEIEALLRGVSDDGLGLTDRMLYLAATMAGLRQGELIALRWQDVDWIAGVIRVRRTFTRGQFGTPKSRRSMRAIPMADRLAGELERHFQRSGYQADDDLVLCHPHTGGPYDASKMRKRFNAAIRTAGIRPVRFHDLRHSSGMAMAAAGAPLRALQEWMGHRDYKTTSIYAATRPTPRRARSGPRQRLPASRTRRLLNRPPQLEVGGKFRTRAWSGCHLDCLSPLRRRSRSRSRRTTWQEGQVKDPRVNIIGRAIATAAGLAAAMGGIVVWALGIASLLFGVDVYAPDIAILWLVAIVVPFVLAATLLMKEKAKKRPDTEAGLTLVSRDAKVSLPPDGPAGTGPRSYPAPSKSRGPRVANQFGARFNMQRTMNDVHLGVRVSPALLRQFDLACRVERRSRSAGIRDAMAAYVAKSRVINEKDASTIKLLRTPERRIAAARGDRSLNLSESCVQRGALNPATARDWLQFGHQSERN